MPEQSEDFWPSDIGVSNLVTPVALMRDQAALLGQKTNQQVKAEVVTSSLQGGTFVQHFNIVVPSLDNYRYELFRIQHEITLYPLALYWQNTSMSISSQHVFIPKLKEILGSDATKKVVQALLAQISR